MTTLTYRGTLTVVTCWCGIRSAIPEELEYEAQRSGRATYCPLGHSGVYTGKTTEERLKETQRQVKATRDLLAAEERSHAATRGHMTRAKKRVSAGVCPCCNRSFQNLHRHMNSKHPDYTKEVAA